MISKQAHTKQISLRLALLMACTVGGVAVAIYASIGSPGANGGLQPAAAAQPSVFAPAASAAPSPSLFPLSPAPSSASKLPDVATMVRGLEQKLAQAPANAEGWRMLGWSYVALERYADAAGAYRRALELDDGVARFHSGYGEALVKQAENQVTADALAHFQTALALDPADMNARYYLGMAKRQDGDLRGAYSDWQALLAEATPNSTVERDLRREIASLQQELGISAAATPPVTGSAAPHAPVLTDQPVTRPLSREEREQLNRILTDDKPN